MAMDFREILMRRKLGSDHIIQITAKNSDVYITLVHTPTISDTSVQSLNSMLRIVISILH